MDKGIIMKTDSISRYKLKRTLESLASKEGRGTELITLYVPPDRQIHEVMNNLREEKETASNIKSKTTKKNVQDAIEKVTQRLKLFKKPPPSGLAIFCGAIPQNGPGSEKMELYTIVPLEPINVYFYRCDNRFHLEPLQEITREKDTYGIILIDGNEATLAILRGRRMEIIKEMTSGIAGKHRAGGQSARRFERIREAEVNSYFKRVGSNANDILGKISDLKGIIIGGPGPTKIDFSHGEFLNYMIKEKIIATLDTSYVGKGGVEEVIQKSSEILRGVRYAEEKILVQKFLYEIGHDSGLAIYGEEDVKKNLKIGSVDILLLSEGVNIIRAKIICTNCNYSTDQLLEPREMISFEKRLLEKKCPNCSNITLTFADSKDLLTEFIEAAENSNTQVEIISVETEEGVMLRDSFGGIAAILRYK
jgi:peptide chain release factor subunit 1